MSDVPSYPVRTKLPDEMKTLTFDFSAELAPGTTLTDMPVVELTGEIAGTLAVSGAVFDDTLTLVSALVSGGAMGDVGLVQCRCYATDGERHEIRTMIQVAPVN